jgi:hypothetical protein
VFCSVLHAHELKNRISELQVLTDLLNGTFNVGHWAGLGLAVIRSPIRTQSRLGVRQMKIVFVLPSGQSYLSETPYRQLNRLQPS